MLGLALCSRLRKRGQLNCQGQTVLHTGRLPSTQGMSSPKVTETRQEARMPVAHSRPCCSIQALLEQAPGHPRMGEGVNPSVRGSERRS